VYALYLDQDDAEWNDCLSDSYCYDNGVHAVSIDDSASEEVVEEHWDVSDEDIGRDFNICEVEIQRNVDSQPPGIEMLMLSFLLLWTSFYGISAAALNHLVQFLHYFFSLLAPLSPPIAALLDFFS